MTNGQQGYSKPYSRSVLSKRSEAREEGGLSALKRGRRRSRRTYSGATAVMEQAERQPGTFFCECGSRGGWSSGCVAVVQCSVVERGMEDTGGQTGDGWAHLGVRLALGTLGDAG